MITVANRTTVESHGKYAKTHSGDRRSFVRARTSRPCDSLTRDSFGSRLEYDSNLTYGNQRHTYAIQSDCTIPSMYKVSGSLGVRSGVVKEVTKESTSTNGEKHGVIFG